MELLEKVAVALGKALSADEYCGKEKSKSEGWEAVIDGLQGEGDPSTLRQNLLHSGKADPVAQGRPLQQAAGWDLFDCDQGHFPYQSHHLVPEKQLPKHKVTFWLIKKSKKSHPKYKLAADTNYDTNDARNGYFMPFASTTHQWQSTQSLVSKGKICEEMMRRTRLQLHQGPHSHRDYLEDNKDVETAGYKSMVKQLLNVVYDRTELHVETCDVCKGKGKPAEVQPLEATVRHVHRVSQTLKGLLVLQRIFVSKRAANYFGKHQTSGFLVHPSGPIFP